MEISADALRRMVDEAIEDDPTALVEVARLRPELLAPYHLRLAEAGVSYAPDLYRGMTEETAAELVRRVDAGADPGLVYLLAVSGTATAVEAVRRWSAERPAWTADFHGTVAHAGHGGGWELDSDGGRRDLASATAYALIPTEGPGISGGTVNDASCGWCGMTLWRLLELDAARATEILGRESGAVVVGCCVRCGCYTDYFTAHGRFVEGPPRPDFLGHEGDEWELPAAPPLGAGPRRPTPFAGNAWEAGGSTLGGTPDWIQDPACPACPRCGRTMFYLGQVTGEDAAGEFAEGCHYAFHDPDCGISAAVYQQS
ncbi:hypothetical protein [Catenuloplanes indicus]|uniref:DUF1963 domain-containing protein n=1 Tax=Catenuloplanes indicus TaxID=137267 RepID=A0AAE3VU31_9ACTN|nr:hypothetical protein [Catenuloplanes indicus]MDQ0364243.1 hypothetical protein [Catenuloplanes indicus]